MAELLSTNSDQILSKCLASTLANIDVPGAKLTYVSLKQFQRLAGDRPPPVQTTKLKEAVVRTGAYYFGPMFVLDKGTNIPSPKILEELGMRGFYTESLQYLNNAQLNLFFIILKCRGLVTDRHFMSYMKYGV